jgi:hypothetical protein
MMTMEWSRFRAAVEACATLQHALGRPQVLRPEWPGRKINLEPGLRRPIGLRLAFVAACRYKTRFVDEGGKPIQQTKSLLPQCPICQMHVGQRWPQDRRQLWLAVGGRTQKAQSDAAALKLLADAQQN